MEQKTLIELSELEKLKLRQQRFNSGANVNTIDATKVNNLF